MRMGRMGTTALPMSAPDRNRIAERYEQGVRVKFTYQTPNIAALNAAAATTNTIQFDLDSRFIWLRTTIWADLAGAAITSGALIVPLITLQITDTGSGQQLMNAPIPVGMISGFSGQLPYVEPSPQEIAPNTTYQFSWINFAAATNYANVRFQLHGYKVYGSSAPVNAL